MSDEGLDDDTEWMLSAAYRPTTCQSAAMKNEVTPMTVTQDNTTKLASNFAAITDFLNALDPGGEFTFTTQVMGNEMQKLHGTLSDIGCELERRNQDRANVYVTINQTDGVGRKASNIKGLRALFIDCDGFSPDEFHLPPSIVIQSKNGRHVYWLLEEGQTLNQFSEAQKALAKHYGSDPKVHDLPRLMRLPGFYHMKDPTDPYMVELLEVNDRRYTVDEVLEGIRTSELTALFPTIQSHLPQSKLDAAVKAAATKVRNSKEGNRNDTLYQQACEMGKLLHLGLDADWAYVIIQGAAAECGLQPSEVEETWKSGLQEGQKKGATEALLWGGGNKPTSKAKQLSNIITADYAGRLSYDIDDNVMCLDKVGYDFIGALHREIADKYDVDIPISLLETYLRDEALKHPFSPVAEYLRELPEWDGVERVSKLAVELFGTAQLTHQTYLTKFGISAVARALDPGCQVDTVLLIQGPQGYGKTSFFRILGGPFYDNYGQDTNDKDALMKVQKAWILEMDEFENTYTRRGISALKSFITQRTDKFRAPYARVIEEHPRHCVLVGSTNESEFLADSTGNRRYWVVPLNKPLDLSWLEENRDQLWAEYIHLYEQGVPWHLSSEEQQQSNQFNEEYESPDPWVQPMQEWLEGGRPADEGVYYDGQPFTVVDVLINAIGKRVATINKVDQMRVGKILKDVLGYTKKRTTPEGKTRDYYWSHPTKTFERVDIDDDAHF